MVDKTKSNDKDDRLKSALRDNLRRRKAAARKPSKPVSEKGTGDASTDA